MELLPTPHYYTPDDRPEGSREELLLLLLLPRMLLPPSKGRHRASSRTEESSASMAIQGLGIGARQCSRGALGGRRATYKSGVNRRKSALRQDEYGLRQAPDVWRGRFLLKQNEYWNRFGGLVI